MWASSFANNLKSEEKAAQAKLSPQSWALIQQKASEGTDGIIQRVGNIDLTFNDSNADDADLHDDYGVSQEAWPKNGDLSGDTKNKFESKLVQDSPLYNNYYGIVVNQEQDQDTEMTDAETMQTKAIIQRLRKQVNTSNFGNNKWFDYDRNNKDNIDFSQNKEHNGQNPEHANSYINLETGVNKAGWGQMRSGKLVKIAGASRSRHFSIGDRVQGIKPTYRKGKWTWHHETGEYMMSMVDMKVHNAFWHKGGVSFWT